VSQQLIFDFNVDNKDAIASINAFFDVYEKGVQGMASMMSDALGAPVEKKVEITMQGDKAVAKEVEVVDKKVNDIVTATKVLNGEFGKTPNQLKKQIAVFRAIQGNLEKFDSKTGKVSQSWEKVVQVISQLEAKLQKLGSASGGLDTLENKLVNSQIAGQTLINTFSAIVGGISKLIQTGAEMEVLFLQLKGFTGSTEEASAAYQEFVEIGAKTPFTAKQVAQAARTMMGFGIETNTATVQVERLAIVAAATGGELGHMARNLGQIKANQKAYTRDLMQFANHGIPIYSEMAEILGTNTQRIREMAEEGQIGFGLVSEALRQMTKDGSSIKTIADDMDKTFAAKFESLVSQIESLSGNVLTYINTFDQAMGGILMGTLDLIINVVRGLSDGFLYLRQNIDELLPILNAVTAALAVATIIAAVSNWNSLTAALGGFLKVTKIALVAQKAWNVVKAIGIALTGNFALALAAAGAAALLTVAVTKQQTEAEEDLNEELKKNTEEWDGRIETMDEAIFATKEFNSVQKKKMEGLKEEYDRVKDLISIERQKSDALIQVLRDNKKSLEESQEGRRESIKMFYDLEKDLHTSNHERIKNDYDERIEKEQQLLEEMRARHREEMDELGGLSAAERQLEAWRREELQLQARGVEFTKTAGRLAAEERLNAQAALDRMDRRVAQERLRSQQRQEAINQEKKISNLETDKEKALNAEKIRHEERLGHLEAEEAALDNALEKLQDGIDQATQLYDEMYSDVRDQQDLTHQQVMQQLQEQRGTVRLLKQEMIAAYREAQNLNKEVGGTNQNNGASTGGANDPMNVSSTQARGGQGGRARWAGGPVLEGLKYAINEFGKELFVSVDGAISRLEAPAFSTWTAPSAGTIIPAHLASQLNIPAEGLSVSGNAALNASGMGASSTALQAGDNINNTVTVQSMNPQQTASHMMVELTKVRRRRMRR